MYIKCLFVFEKKRFLRNCFVRYLIPCGHVMCSQRCHITNVETYEKNAERFLALRPSFMNKNHHVDRYEFDDCFE